MVCPCHFFMRPRHSALSASSLALRPVRTHLSRSLPSLCFHSLTTIKSCNSFFLIFLQHARECVPLSLLSRVPYTLPSCVCCKSFVCHSYENCRGVGVFFPFWNEFVLGEQGASQHSDFPTFERCNGFCRMVPLRRPPHGATMGPVTGKQLRPLRCLREERTAGPACVRRRSRLKVPAWPGSQVVPGSIVLKMDRRARWPERASGKDADFPSGKDGEN